MNSQCGSRTRQAIDESSGSPEIARTSGALRLVVECQDLAWLRTGDHPFEVGVLARSVAGIRAFGLTLDPALFLIELLLPAQLISSAFFQLIFLCDANVISRSEPRGSSLAAVVSYCPRKRAARRRVFRSRGRSGEIFGIRELRRQRRTRNVS
jgi:hypothetical protein